VTKGSVNPTQMPTPTSRQYMEQQNQQMVEVKGKK